MAGVNRAEFTALIAERAQTEPEFRARLLADPSAVISEMIGAQVPQTVKFTVHEESPTDIHLVIPAATDLSEGDLELVSGGWNWWDTLCGG